MQENKQLKLLVVDDEESIVDYTMKIYARKGFVTFGAKDGLTAVEIFRKEKPDISLIDINMPYSPFDGIETLRKIKELDKDALCIMVTCSSDSKNVEKARSLGACAYIFKPVRIEEIDKVISQVRGNNR